LIKTTQALIEKDVIVNAFTSEAFLLKLDAG
jgi:hypothetical protein